MPCLSESAEVGEWLKKIFQDLGTFVQSVISLTSSLRAISLTILADSIYNFLKFFAEKMWVAFALQKLLTFFQQKFQHICISLDVNFNVSLANDVVSFEQLGPVFHDHSPWKLCGWAGIWTCNPWICSQVHHRLPMEPGKRVPSDQRYKMKKRKIPNC